MLEAFRMNVGTRLAGMKFRKAKDDVISFASAISGSNRALVVMPLDRRELLSAIQIIDLLKHRFDEKHITVVGDERGLETIRLMPRSHFVQIKDADVNAWYHPKPEFLARLKGTTFDLAIDLNLDLLLPSAYICRESNAKIRIGFTGPLSDKFFNFQIQPDPSQTRRGIYDRVAKCLRMF